MKFIWQDLEEQSFLQTRRAWTWAPGLLDWPIATATTEKFLFSAFLFKNVHPELSMVVDACSPRCSRGWGRRITWAQKLWPAWTS
jgi:hypothetical protein